MQRPADSQTCKLHKPCLCRWPSVLNCKGCLRKTDFSAIREALASTEIVEPRIPVVSNVDAKAHSDPEAIRDILARQVSVWLTSLQPCLQIRALLCVPSWLALDESDTSTYSAA